MLIDGTLELAMSSLIREILLQKKSPKSSASCTGQVCGGSRLTERS